jgi:hypothetical protein
VEASLVPWVNVLEGDEWTRDIGDTIEPIVVGSIIYHIGFQDASHGRYDALPPRKTVDRLNFLILIMRAVVNVTRGS